MNVTVVALGKIGLPLAVQFASKGHRVIGADINPETVALVNEGVEPFPGEAHLGEKLADAVGAGLLSATTDTAAALRAMEIKADVILKATKVDGVYDSDPVKNKQAKKFERLGFLDVLNQNLKVMDLTAITLLKDSQIPIVVFDMNQRGNLKRVVADPSIGTEVYW